MGVEECTSTPPGADPRRVCADFLVSESNRSVLFNLFTWPDEKVVPETGVVVANFGQHPADGEHHDSLSQYSQLVEDFARDAAAWRDTGSSGDHFRAVVWLPSPYVPLRSDGWVVAKKD